MEIQATNISKRYNQSWVFESLSFTIFSGEMVAIVGESGSGKTTLLNCLGQLEELSTGELLINRGKLTKKKLRYFFQKDAGFLFQNFALIDNETVKENLYLVTQDDVAIEEALEQFNIASLLNEKVYTLSGGEQQRVALVRLLLKQPKIIFADEPTASLDKENGILVMKALKELNKQGKTVIVVTHDQNLLTYFDRVLYLTELKKL
ncbi:TPA: ATP-binding cassette domain-containing protein [Enterococcus faecalis]|uniref:ABC transporter ATP-binding protein n=1 Tax=Enterococcus faecalis TaxID=1351 RepID=UPI00155EE07D|nr:ATP-binding cassette domain-containing protein [Enterococcus faecalis]EGO8836573.1 ATP-binding cassette domain-containing protein [Enterococcus faecalis]EHQ8831176.1 ATP-binding cassette domain-containing protein [Enterococcus faecalis]MCO5395397.1 ATP-binding cassette domain-containing protein [Enterococcus faecalis]MDT2124440.1 ATP-binding cassette domain-containing protein [Enterococcus faecalis]NRC72999.1 ATP-binding cassette domain-containing protein [Enterococcus faecalis]